MQRHTDHSAVLARCPDDEELPWLQGDRRELPFHQIRRAICQIPTAECESGGVGIMNLDPIRKIAILIRDRRCVIRHELTQNRIP